MDGALPVDSSAMHAAAGQERAREGWANPSLGLNPMRDEHGALIIPHNCYGTETLPTGTGLGGGILGGTLDNLLNLTVDQFLAHIRQDSFFTRNPVVDVIEGHFLTPFNVNAFGQVRVFSGLGDINIAHVSIGEKMAAMSGLHNPSTQQGMGH